MSAPLSASRVGNAGTGELPDPRVDNNEELCPAPRSPTRSCATSLAALDPAQRREVATELRRVAENFAEVPDGRDTAHALRMLAHMLGSG